MDIAGLVRAVNAAFEDAGKLVKRICKDREAKGDPLPVDRTQDLLDSLNLGPVLVRGHYDHDLKRFGEQYACGDGQAREQMQNVLINLQTFLIITLHSIMMDDADVDFNTLQSASDDCRVNAGVCLGQLSQRLSSAIQAQAYYPSSTPGAALPPMSPSLAYSSSRSTHSSPAPYRTPRTPDPGLDMFNNMNISSSGVRASFIERKTSTSSGGSQDPYQRPSFGLPLPRPTDDYVGKAAVTQPTDGLKADEMDPINMRRRSSQALAHDDNILLMFPRPGGQPILSAPPNGMLDSGQSSPRVNNSLTSSPDVSRTSSATHQRHVSRDRFGPDDFHDEQQLIRDDGRQYSHSTIYDMYQPPTPERHASTSYSQRTQTQATPPHSTLEHVRYLQDNARPPRPQPRSDSLFRLPMKTFQPQDQPRKPVRSNTAKTELSTSPADLRQWQSRPSFNGPIPVNTSPIDENLVRPPIPQGLPQPPQSPIQSNVSKHLSPTNSILNPATSRTESIRTTNSSLSAPTASVTIASGPLTLPTDKNLLGFCKGAFRLQIGLESKAFKVANRPVGYASMIQYWRCEKCSYEGPVYNSAVLADSNGKKRPKASWKPVKLFDPKVRTSESGAIRYKWAFLAKCHVVMKGMVPYETALGQSGAFGTFGCIFCAAEGKQRGWLDHKGLAGGGYGASLTGSGGASIWSDSVKGSTTTAAAAANTAARKSDAKHSKGYEANSTPIFGNIGSFLAHLEDVHGSSELGWPNAEMQGRMKLVVGRTAPVEEEGWDINFVPPPL